MWRNQVAKIAKDNIHGASYLLKEATKILIHHCGGEEIREIASALINAQPWMAPIYNVAMLAIQHPTNCDVLIKEFLAKEQEERKTLVQKGADLIQDGDRIVTHSFSSIVFDIIKLASQKKKFSLLCSESRPKLEGIELAREAQRYGIDVEVAIDAAIPFLLRKSDKIFFGADGIGDFGLVHKIGSYPIALAADKVGISCFAFATTSRIWPKGYRLPSQPKKPCTEIASDLPCINYYFDITPANLFTLIYP